MLSNTLRTTLNPSSNLSTSTRDGELIYLSHDNDPYFYISSHEEIIKAGWYSLNYSLTILDGAVVLPKLYFDFGNGCEEKFHWKLFYDGNEIYGFIKVPWDCLRLRLDISESNVGFKSGNFTLKKVNKVKAALQLYTVLKKNEKAPSSFLKDLMVQKGVSNKKKLIRSLFEGKYLTLSYQKNPNETTEGNTLPSESSELDILKYSSLGENIFKFFLQSKREIANKKAKVSRANRKISVDIILPVYNGYEYLVKLLPQIITASDLNYTFYIIDDCSPDPKISKLLKRYKAANTNVILNTNEQNLGFTKTVNKLLSYCKGDVIVLLNSDIEVPSNWLSKLIEPILLDDKVATVTPISNCATICSFPNLGDNPLFQGYDVDKMNKTLSTLDTYYEEIPTGVGFCMAINKRAIEKVGNLNEQAFPRGYGEEVDFCFRARKKGFKNVLNTNLFVYHKHGGSFTSAEKTRLLSENQQKLEKMHPDFQNVLEKYFADNTFIYLKLIYLLKIVKSEKRELCLFLDHELGGGTNHYSNNYQIENDKKVFIYGQYLNPNRNYSNQILFSIRHENYNFRFALNNINILFELLDLYSISINEIIVNNLVSYSNTEKLISKLAQYKKTHKVMLKVMGHDFYPVCPNFILFRENKEFCHIPDKIDICNKCIKSLPEAIDPILVPNDFRGITAWRSMWRELLEENTDEIIVFSNSTKELFLKVWPQIINKIKVTPHNLVGFQLYNKKVRRIGILGNIHSVAKGAKFIHELAEHIESNNIENYKLVSIGGINSQYDHPSIEKIGSYKQDELHFLLLQNKIDVVFIPSVWPETFSFTTREAIETGIPTCCFNFGGQHDQVKNYTKGIVVTKIEPAALIDTIETYFNKINEKNSCPDAHILPGHVERNKGVRIALK